MSVDTFLDLLDTAVSSKVGPDEKLGLAVGESWAERVFERKYSARHISYQGERWIADSERFPKVFKRMGNTAAVGR